MKTPSDDVFLLIKSLSPSEKRYFRMAAQSREKDSAYYRLFDAIDAQKDYDEQALLKKYGQEKFARNLPMAKKYLLELLLKTLCDYAAGSNTHYDITEKINAAGILQLRGLYELSRKLLKNARSKAEQFGSYALAAQAIRQELMHFNSSPTADFENELHSLHSEYTRLLDILQQESELIYLQNLTLSTWFEAPYLRSGQMMPVEEIMQHPILQPGQEPQEPGLRYRYHNIMSRCYSMLGNYEQSFLHAKAEIEAIEQFPHRIRENYLLYLAQLHNLFSRCVKAQRYDELYPILRKVRAVPATTIAVRKFRLESFYSLEIYYYHLMRQYDKALALIPEIESEYEALYAKIRRQHRFTLLFNVMTVYLYTGQYRRALDYANKALDETPVIPQLYNIVRLLCIIIHSELHNDDILDASIRSTHRYLKKQGNLHRVEEIILRYLRRLGDVTDRPALHALLRQVRDELNEAAADPLEARVLEYFDFGLLIDAKLHGTTIADYQKHTLPDGDSATVSI